MKILSKKTETRFSLYINGRPVEAPAKPIPVTDKDTFCIGDTVPGKELTWDVTEFENGSNLWSCSRVLVQRMGFEVAEVPVSVDGMSAEISYKSSVGWKPVLHNVRNTETWLLKICSSSGDEEPDQKFGSFEDAWVNNPRLKSEAW